MAAVKKNNNRWKKLKDSKYLLIMIAPAILYFIIFHYLPMYGVTIAFKDYKPFKGYFASSWVGLKHFRTLFKYPYVWRMVRNTFLLSFYSLIWGFPAPIIFALILNEVKNERGKRFVQTVTYLPHFISTVVIVSMVTMFLSPSTGILNTFIKSLGLNKVNFMGSPKYWRTIYISSGIWSGVGWGSILYLAALTNIDPTLYESAIMDGANTFQKIIHINIPCIAPTIITMLILRTGQLMSVGFEKVYLLQGAVNLEVSEVIQTYVYTNGLRNLQYSYGTAIGLLNSIVNISFLFAANYISRSVNETSLW
ncbi:MAG TPA: sugar ABC transporter permease [Clostridiaceae bacterium]|nr:sugar ABC transporter permease [Clostridiaceae bacterium]